MNTYPETPDAWIEREEPCAPPSHDDACMVCDKIDCVCEPEQCVASDAIEEMESWQQGNPEGEQ